ncbi:MAG TPA: 30S ribosomal protein S7 [Planctomycetaceae bacterium]|nr:30S ribosomal protein S7 [Blastopirellula sp.]HAY79243.1 30S ribosomal protein S7 [Planctomycetaceae bacterium]|tara:strand:+ start:492 stop:962 length:471 start_codon:yes stop_codon:yes gene_type:complete
MGRITASRKQLKPDPLHGSEVASKFINVLMWDGKKTVAQAVFYNALAEISKRIKDSEPIEVFHQAIENVKPQIEVRSKRVGGASYQVPMQVNRARQQALAFRWVLGAVRDKKGRPTHLKLADELAAAYNKEGAAMTKRENTHRMAEANKAFAHFAW